MPFTVAKSSSLLSGAGSDDRWLGQYCPYAVWAFALLRMRLLATKGMFAFHCSKIRSDGNQVKRRTLIKVSCWCRLNIKGIHWASAIVWWWIWWLAKGFCMVVSAIRRLNCMFTLWIPAPIAHGTSRFGSWLEWALARTPLLRKEASTKFAVLSSARARRDKAGRSYSLVHIRDVRRMSADRNKSVFKERAGSQALIITCSMLVDTNQNSAWRKAEAAWTLNVSTLQPIAKPSLQARNRSFGIRRNQGTASIRVDYGDIAEWGMEHETYEIAVIPCVWWRNNRVFLRWMY